MSGLNPDGVARRIEAAAASAAEAAAWVLRKGAVDRAPVDTGDMRDQSHVSPAGGGTRPQYDVVFPLVYSAVQHERTDFNHPRGGEAKYLENAMREDLPQIEQVIEDMLKGHL